MGAISNATATKDLAVEAARRAKAEAEGTCNAGTHLTEWKDFKRQMNRRDFPVELGDMREKDPSKLFNLFITKGNRKMKHVALYVELQAKKQTCPCGRTSPSRNASFC